MKPFFKEKDVKLKTSRSSGPGGQNVNKRSTKAQARLPVGKVAVSEEMRARIRAKLRNRINKDDELEAECEEERTQKANKEKALSLLHSLIAGAVKIQKKRILTKISRSAEAKFQAAKKKEAEKKRLRKFLPKEWLE